MADIVDNIVGEIQNVASGKSGKKKKKGAKKGGDPTMSILLAAGVVGIGYLIYKNSSGSQSGSGAPVVGAGTIASIASTPVTSYSLSADAGGPIQADPPIPVQVYF